MGAVVHANAGATGIGRQLQVVRGVAHHQGALGWHTQLCHQLMQHARMRLARGLIGGAAGMEQVFQVHMRQGLVQPPSAFPGGHGQEVLTRFQIGQHLQYTGEQRNLVLLASVMVFIALAQQRVFLLGDIGRRMRQCLTQAQTDHISRILVTGHATTHIAHRALDGAHDDGS